MEKYTFRDLSEKAAAMREFRRLRDAGLRSQKKFGTAMSRPPTTATPRDLIRANGSRISRFLTNMVRYGA